MAGGGEAARREFEGVSEFFVRGDRVFSHAHVLRELGAPERRVVVEIHGNGSRRFSWRSWRRPSVIPEWKARLALSRPWRNPARLPARKTLAKAMKTIPATEAMPIKVVKALIRWRRGGGVWPSFCRW